MVTVFIHTFIKFFFLLTPFFLLTTFISMTVNFDNSSKKKISVKTTFSVIVICIILFFIGNQIFAVFGITLNAFRIGTGVLLFLSAITLVSGQKGEQENNSSEEIAVVPLAIPVAVGPATTGALLVMGGELPRITEKIGGVAGIVAAVLCVGVLLYSSSSVEKVVGKQGLVILSKLTGLILAALAAQMVMTGILGFFGK